MDGQSHEDKNKDYLEKQLIESWERIIDRNETKNLDFCCPKECGVVSDNMIYLDLKKNMQAQPSKKQEPEEDNQKLIDIVNNALNSSTNGAK